MPGITVKELKEVLSHLPDDVLVSVQQEPGKRCISVRYQFWDESCLTEEEIDQLKETPNIILIRHP